MDKQQWALILGSIGLVALLYFGFNTTPSKQRLVEKSRVGNIEEQETSNILRDASQELPEDMRAYVKGLEHMAERSPEDSVRIEALKALSGVWFRQGQYLLAGHYAEQVAQITGTADGWAIAGTTYGRAFDSDEAPPADLVAEGAIRAFEHAISLDPQNPEYRINLAICYAEHPPADNPMKGIQLLLDLNRKDPENVTVLYQLARLGIRTGQYEKARERLEYALRLAPDQPRLHCLMVDLLRDMQLTDGLAEHQARCKQQG